MNKLEVALPVSFLLLAAVCFFLLRDSGTDLELDVPQEDSVLGEDVGNRADAGRDEGERDSGVAVETAATLEDVATAEPESLTGPTLSGIVLDDYAMPLSGATVALVRESSTRSPFDRMRSGDRTAMMAMIMDRQGGVHDSKQRELLRRNLVARVATDSEGRFAFAIDALPKGEYRVLAQHTSFAADSESWSWSPESSVIDFQLGPGSAISGIVVDENNRPIARAYVSASQDRDGGRGGFGRGGIGRGGGALDVLWKGLLASFATFGF